MKIFKSILIILFLCIPKFGHTQDIDARSPHVNGGSSQQQKADKKKVEKKQLTEKAIEKGRKRNLNFQTKNTKKMMKKSKHSSSNWNANKREFFLKRWFTKKHH